MKKIFTPENYIAGFLTVAVLFIVCFLLVTFSAWKIILSIAGVFVIFSVLGYIVNKIIKKFSK